MERDGGEREGYGERGRERERAEPHKKWILQFPCSELLLNYGMVMFLVCSFSVPLVSSLLLT